MRKAYLIFLICWILYPSKCLGEVILEEFIIAHKPISNVRTSPWGEVYCKIKKISIFKKNDHIIGKKGKKWYPIEACGKKGFIHESQIRIIKDDYMDLTVKELKYLLGDDADAQFTIGFKYLHGDGVDKNEKEAFKWFEKSAKNNDATSQLYLGHMYNEGYGVESDFEKSIYWYEKSVKQGNLDAQFYLGLKYGERAELHDYAKKALDLIKDAARKGHQKSISALDEIGINALDEIGINISDNKNYNEKKHSNRNSVCEEIESSEKNNVGGFFENTNCQVLATESLNDEWERVTYSYDSFEYLQKNGSGKKEEIGSSYGITEAKDYNIKTGSYHDTSPFQPVHILMPKIIENLSVIPVRLSFHEPLEKGDLLETFFSNKDSQQKIISIKNNSELKVSKFSFRIRAQEKYTHISYNFKKSEAKDKNGGLEIINRLKSSLSSFEKIKETPNKYNGRKFRFKKNIKNNSLRYLIKNEMALENYVDRININIGTGSISIKMTPYISMNPVLTIHFDKTTSLDNLDIKNEVILSD